MTLQLHEIEVDIHGKNDAVITRASRLYYSDGCYIGISFPPDAVRAVLHDTNLFLPSEIDAWPSDDSVLVPPGTSSCHRVPAAAVLRGYTYKAEYWRGTVEPCLVNDERVYTGFVWARNGELLEGPVQNMEQAKL